MKTLILATRGSLLARTQSNLVQQQLEQTWPNLKIEQRIVKTSGDQIQDRPLREVGGKGLFVKEIEEILLKGEADFAVHSMKDVPSLLPDPFMIGAILPREDPFDLLITQEPHSLETLPQRSRIGTTSLRRAVQILKIRPDLKVVQLRGNIDTRLRKLKEGEYDAIILAAAGLNRLKVEVPFFVKLDFVPPPGQGAIGIEFLKSSNLENIFKPLNDISTSLTVQTEREISHFLEGSCELPFGVFVQKNGEKIQIKAFVSNPKGEGWVDCSLEGRWSELELLKKQTIQLLLEKGGKEILQQALKR